jgi:leucyl aminopeptidase
MSTLLSAAAAGSRPVWTASPDTIGDLPPEAAAWAGTLRFKAGAGEVLLVPGSDGAVLSAILGLGPSSSTDRRRQALLAGALATSLADGDWHLAEGHGLDADMAGLAFLLGGYRFDRYRSKPSATDAVQLFPGEGADTAAAAAIGAGAFLARDLINTPANDMGPDAIERAARSLAERFGADIEVVVGDDLLSRNFPMIHAVGRASAIAPRLIDLSFGRRDAPKVTLVGKGVSFDTGGLDIKPASGMLLMKKDMGGAANVLGLAQILMTLKLDIRLRVLVPAVENAISGSAFRPSDILKSRKGKTVEIGNTDAEGRLVLADALALADEEAPEILIDMATLTGAARVALGPELPPFFTDDEALAAELSAASLAVSDPIWRLPLWQPYAKTLASKVADTNNVTPDGFAGAITAALFLQGFVEKAGAFAHFDIYGWRPQAGPTGPVGGEAQAIRAIHHMLKGRYPQL